MLNFMREQGLEDSLPAKPSGVSSEIGTETSSDAANQNQQQEQTENYNGPEEYLTVANQDKNVRRGTIILAVFFVTGLLCLWFMIKKTKLQPVAAAVTTEEAQIEAALSELTGVESEMTGGMKEIVNKFYEFSNAGQLKLNELTKNPFRTDRFFSFYDAQEDLCAAEDNLELYSIMQSDQGYCCMINGKILYEGDLISGFKVCQIGDNFVKLEQKRIQRDPIYGENIRGAQMILKLSE
jgi:preprotein translocase subunit SecG